MKHWRIGENDTKITHSWKKPARNHKTKRCSQHADWLLEQFGGIGDDKNQLNCEKHDLCDQEKAGDSKNDHDQALLGLVEASKR